uniref:Uncharacterized protein n=1 Tax=Geospiza parvula TaxID=87175 RepID=A0A8U8B9S5_GEOPR
MADCGTPLALSNQPELARLPAWPFPLANKTYQPQFLMADCGTPLAVSNQPRSWHWCQLGSGEASCVITDFQEPAGHSGPVAPKHKQRAFPSETKLTSPDCGTPLALSNQPELALVPAWVWEASRVIAGFSGASRATPGLWPPNINNGPFPLKQKLTSPGP